VLYILFDNVQAAVIVYVLQVLILLPYFLWTMQRIHPPQDSQTKASNPSISSWTIALPLVGILLHMAIPTIPDPVQSAIFIVKVFISIVFLFSFGLTMGDVNLVEAIKHTETRSIVLTKNIVQAMIALCIGLIMGLEGYWLQSLLITASAPPAYLVYLLSKNYDVETPMIKNVIALSTLVSLPCLALVVYAT
jgi:predicted permease